MRTRTLAWEEKRLLGARAQRGDWEERVSQRACRGKESAWRRGACARAVVSPRPRARARGRRTLFSSDPPPSSTSTRGEGREQGSVGRGGRGVARARGLQKEGGGRRERSKTTLPRYNLMILPILNVVLTICTASNSIVLVSGCNCCRERWFWFHQMCGS